LDLIPPPSLFLLKIYLARFKSTLHGFCVACSKIDAIVVGAFIFNYIAQSKMTLSLAGPNPRYLPSIGLRNTVFILLSLNFLGLVLTVGETRMGTLPMSLTWGCEKNVEHPYEDLAKSGYKSGIKNKISSILFIYLATQ
jgi:hypothetical protein